MFVGLTRVLLIEAGLPELAAPPVIPPVTSGTAQLYVVPAGTVPFNPLTGAISNAWPLHSAVVIGRIEGPGLIVTDTVNEGPAQVPVTGVTV